MRILAREICGEPAIYDYWLALVGETSSLTIVRCSEPGGQEVLFLAVFWFPHSNARRNMVRSVR